MDAQHFRAMAERCREMGRLVARDDVREQLRQWADDFDGEAAALERRPVSKRAEAADN